jgi:hypothetical protein
MLIAFVRVLDVSLMDAVNAALECIWNTSGDGFKGRLLM